MINNDWYMQMSAVIVRLYPFGNSACIQHILGLPGDGLHPLAEMMISIQIKLNRADNFLMKIISSSFPDWFANARTPYEVLVAHLWIATLKLPMMNKRNFSFHWIRMIIHLRRAGWGIRCWVLGGTVWLRTWGMHFLIHHAWSTLLSWCMIAYGGVLNGLVMSWAPLLIHFGFAYS